LGLGESHSIILTDIDLGGQISTRQSTSGYLLYLNGQLFHWRGRTERLIITATAAGEYIALSRRNQASKHVNAVMKFFGNHSPHYHLYTDRAEPWEKFLGQKYL
jgi:hypothetical protein